MESCKLENLLSYWEKIAHKDEKFQKRKGDVIK